MRIIKFTEFIKEELINDTPESYVELALKQLKKKIDKIKLTCFISSKSTI